MEISRKWQARASSGLIRGGKGKHPLDNSKCVTCFLWFSFFSCGSERQQSRVKQRAEWNKAASLEKTCQNTNRSEHLEKRSKVMEKVLTKLTKSSTSYTTRSHNTTIIDQINFYMKCRGEGEMIVGEEERERQIGGAAFAHFTSIVCLSLHSW